jgi:hypothetical protein
MVPDVSEAPLCPRAILGSGRKVNRSEGRLLLTIAHCIPNIQHEEYRFRRTIIFRALYHNHHHLHSSKDYYNHYVFGSPLYHLPYIIYYHLYHSQAFHYP